MERSGRKPSAYTGLYTQHIDAKARIILPGAFRRALGKTFIISAGFDRELWLMEKNEWQEFIDREISKRSELSSKARRLSRYFHSSAHDIKIDSQFRFVIPPPLRDGAGLEHEIVLIGARNRVEIWSKKSWDTYNTQTAGMIDEIADELAREDFI
ncbi:MAG: division/cell wall cluster transcriptional repressor MraZ [Candidatus Lindowbacteria bacterium]|nr:division/cell wall cluster transcriptional repressor MraZ [Candidatus Lindowbacteria bacterium]